MCVCVCVSECVCVYVCDTVCVYVCVYHISRTREIMCPLVRTEDALPTRSNPWRSVEIIVLIVIEQ